MPSKKASPNDTLTGTKITAPKMLIARPIYHISFPSHLLKQQLINSLPNLTAIKT
jgi:hypothetical protein